MAGMLVLRLLTLFAGKMPSAEKVPFLITLGHLLLGPERLWRDEVMSNWRLNGLLPCCPYSVTLSVRDRVNSAVSNPMPLLAGAKFRPYEILAATSSVGMGEVNKARDTRLDRIVAIKVLPTHLADRFELRERFEREAKSIARPRANAKRYARFCGHGGFLATCSTRLSGRSRPTAISGCASWCATNTACRTRHVHLGARVRIWSESRVSGGNRKGTA
jgi:hypothetical protein